MGTGVKGASSGRRTAPDVSGTQLSKLPLVALTTLFLAVSSGTFVMAAPVEAQGPGAKATATIVPDNFLRRWDPITIFFPEELGPATGGPEDEPHRFVSLTPAHPGAYRWLDSRTLQFRPVEPWPPLEQFTVEGGNRKLSLETLMSPPVRMLPRNGTTTGLAPVERITLEFSEPLDPADLAKILRIELRPSPGVISADSRWLDERDFEIKVQERSSRSSLAKFVILLRHAIPTATKVVCHFRLSLADSGDESFMSLWFRTPGSFQATRLGCKGSMLPLSPGGIRYTRDQAISCAPSDRAIRVRFSAPCQLGPVEARNFVRISPAVEGLEVAGKGKVLELRGKFHSEQLYRVTLRPTKLTDAAGRSLEMSGSNEVYLFFPREDPYLRWLKANGIAERFGPQMVPLEGRGFAKGDLRIHKIDPLDRSFWPMPGRRVTVDESNRPPGPGEEPAPFKEPARSIYTSEISKQIAALGSPALSTIVSLPLASTDRAASFGLDLKPYLSRISGKEKPGAYLLGLRKLDKSSQRSWMRLQVTDLSLTTVEEAKRVVFVVTSLSTGRPVAKAILRLEGAKRDRQRKYRWKTLFYGTTDAQGRCVWQAPGKERRSSWKIKRLVVRKSVDTLVLNTTEPPEAYHDNVWSRDYSTWLQWTTNQLVWRGPQPKPMVHIFTERPLYRPEEAVHIRGYVRQFDAGRLTPIVPDAKLVVEGPGELKWTNPVQWTSKGNFYFRFQEKKLPTGRYRAYLEMPRGYRYDSVTFRMEAYRLPRFEVELHAPDTVPMDREFKVRLTARYYAGGSAAKLPVKWRISQFPYTWTPDKREGYAFSSDSRYSRTNRFEGGSVVEQSTTDEGGSDLLSLNPAGEATAQPRSYIVEATVTGADEQTVTSTRRILALPPFVLGMKVARYLEEGTELKPEIIVVGHDEKLIAAKKFTLRLYHRQWHSYLEASDFADGVPHYRTDVVDKLVLEKSLISSSKPLEVPLEIAEAGVYLVELEAADRLGRTQTLKVDLFAGGKGPVAWKRPATKSLTVTPHQGSYKPGQLAHLIVQSPFQKAELLVIVEAPEGNRYQWVPVRGGTANFQLELLPTWAPRLPIHLVLMRPRLPKTHPAQKSGTDLGKPTTLASTIWLDVEPMANRIDIDLDYPEKAMPGETVEFRIHLSTPDKTPLSGEVTLWLVDRAVLALAKEQRLDPVPDFLSRVVSYLTLHDTRGLTFGWLPLALKTGGGFGKRKQELLDRVTVRKRFKTVPYYNPTIQVGSDGRALVTVQLPDNLTTFAVRAKATSGAQRFGYAAGDIAVRLPLIVQPALPRFVRPGDRFTATAMGRVVDGPGGPGNVQIQTLGAGVLGERQKQVSWRPDEPQRLEFPVVVGTPPLTDDGKLLYQEVVFQVAVERMADGAKDAFEIKLPILEDRQPVRTSLFKKLKPGKSLKLPRLKEKARPGTLSRSLMIASRPALLSMLGGLDFFQRYPYGCTEQRASRLRTQLAVQKLQGLLQRKTADKELERAFRQTQDWIISATDEDGLCAYWPGSGSSVFLTSWVVLTLLEAAQEGLPVDQELQDRLLKGLERSLRSDSQHLLSGAVEFEKAWALAALAAAGRFQSAYAAELARKARYLDTEGTAQLLLALSDGGATDSPRIPGLLEQLWRDIEIRLHQGKEAYSGLRREWSPDGRILSSEARVLATTAQALLRVDPKNPRLPMLTNALITLGQDDGWGSTNANAAALRALTELLKPPFGPPNPLAIKLRIGDFTEAVTLDEKTPLLLRTFNVRDKGKLTLSKTARNPIAVKLETEYTPAKPGSEASPKANGFVVQRTQFRILEEGDPPERQDLKKGGRTINYTMGTIIEEQVQVVNPKTRNYVAIVVPLAAGMEPLNPRLATAPPEAKPSHELTLEPSSSAYLDHQVAFYYDTLPKGTFNFYFRTRATTEGTFIQPPALAEMMYDASTRGNSAGASIQVTPQEGPPQ